ncbi:serine/threonine-protein kinase [Nocardia aurantia]|uniref:Serine/threonine-protein kinase PknD n=1 Tax=Nocardia aurantia TaxID=2585199 RepID=A0A7K0DX06_9NOCA|nr:serine/threonine-protein kinase [Nocardia aurantia]MQY30313.1 Serine/threonine-protein kinase PknD [Nocardia aurantia]
MKPLGPHDFRTLGHYHLVAVIGQGTMGRVLLGRAPDGRLVAVKVIHRHLAQTPRFRDRFRLEVQASQRVTGAYTAAVMDADPDAGQPWLASVYVAGPALRDVVERYGPLPVGGLGLLAGGLAAALREIHRAGMIHRDLKPANILLGADGPRVIDFGIAHTLDTDLQLTGVGTLLGSPAFMSPEQAEGRPLTPASDIFAAGAVLAAAATGRSPFLGPSVPQTLFNVVHRQADTSGIPEALRPLVDACLAKDPMNRPTPEQLLEMIERIPVSSGWSPAVRQEISAHRSEANRWARSPNTRRFGRRMRWTAAAAVSAVVIGSAILTVATHRPAAVPADPLAGRTLTMSDDQLRLVDTCALLDSNVLGALGRPSAPEPVDSSVCSTKITADGGRQAALSIGVGTAVASATPETTAGVLAGREVLATSDAPRACARTLLVRTEPKLGIATTVSNFDGDPCTLAMKTLRAIVLRLVTEPPQAALPRRSVVRIDPCASLDSSVLSSAVAGPAVRPAETDIHTCTWAGDTVAVTIRTTETQRMDNDPQYRLIQVEGNPMVADFTAARVVAPDGTCATARVQQATTENRAEIIQATAQPISVNARDSACAITERILVAVIDRLENT